MKRVTKKPDERRAEIIAASIRLFAEEGFVEVPVSKIVGEIHVAQGTFYYYFKTKEEVLDAAIEDYLRDLGTAMGEIAEDPKLDPREALSRMVRTEIAYAPERSRELYSIKGCDIHTRMLARLTALLKPRYLAVIERGIGSGVFRSVYPDLVAEIIIFHFLFDREVLGWDEAECERRLKASSGLIEVLLELPFGSLSFV
jgi:Transcriptional regulator